jgi:hypothetical protein
MSSLAIALASLPILWGIQRLIDARLDAAYQRAQREHADRLARARAIVRTIEREMLLEARDG